MAGRAWYDCHLDKRGAQCYTALYNLLCLLCERAGWTRGIAGAIILIRDTWIVRWAGALLWIASPALA